MVLLSGGSSVGTRDLTIEHRWAGQRTFAPDNRYVIGYDRRQPALFWVAALGGHGVTASPAVGRLAPELLLYSLLHDGAESRERQLLAIAETLGAESEERVRRLAPIAESLGVSRAQLALAWALRDEGVSSVIVGATRPEQLADLADPHLVASARLEMAALRHPVDARVALLLAVMADRAIRGATTYKALIIWPYAVAPVVAAVLSAAASKVAASRAAATRLRSRDRTISTTISRSRT